MIENAWERQPDGHRYIDVLDHTAQCDYLREVAADIHATSALSTEEMRDWAAQTGVEAMAREGLAFWEEGTIEEYDSLPEWYGEWARANLRYLIAEHIRLQIAVA